MSEPSLFADAVRAMRHDAGKRVTIEMVGGTALWVTIAEEQPKAGDFIALDIENAICTTWLPVASITSVRDGWHAMRGSVRLRPLPPLKWERLEDVYELHDIIHDALGEEHKP